MNRVAFNKFDLTGKTAVVTGASEGLGYCMARALALSGAKVLIAARRETLLQGAAEKLKAECSSDDVLYRTVDLYNRDGVAEFAEDAIRTLDGVDIFIGNAGVFVGERVEEITDKNLDALLRIHFTANVELMRAFVPPMRRKRWGRVLFSSSIASMVSGTLDGHGVYAAAKAGLNSFARTTAAEVGHDGITVNTIAFGVFMTNMLAEHLGFRDGAFGDGAGKSHVSKIASMTALGRLGDPRELEGIVQLLASDAGSYITGQSIPVDGGMGVMLWANEPAAEPVAPAYCSAAD